MKLEPASTHLSNARLSVKENTFPEKHLAILEPSSTKFAFKMVDSHFVAFLTSSKRASIPCMLQEVFLSKANVSPLFSAYTFSKRPSGSAIGAYWGDDPRLLD